MTDAVLYLVTVIDMDVTIILVMALSALKEVYDLMHEILESPARLERRRHHGHTH